MKNDKHIEKLLRLMNVTTKSNYIVSESPIYKPVLDNENFDPMPDMKEAAPAVGDEKKEPDAVAPTPPTPDPAATTAPAGSLTPAPPTPTPEPTPAPAAATPPAPAAMPSPQGMDISPAPAAPIEPPMPPTPSKEEMQKQVMELQIDAMKKMSAKIQELEDMVGGLNSQLADFSNEVEKVKDPSDVEKFDERKLDSHPYYYNLNDLWNNNTFQARMDNMNTKGIMKNKDGTYQADFDTMPKMNQFQVKDSFDAI